MTGAITAVAVQGVIEAFSPKALKGKALADSEGLTPTAQDTQYLNAGNEPAEGLYRISVGPRGEFMSVDAIGVTDIISDDVIFTNGMSNSFADAVRNGTTHVHKAGLLGKSYVLNFNPDERLFRRSWGSAQRHLGCAYRPRSFRTRAEICRHDSPAFGTGCHRYHTNRPQPGWRHNSKRPSLCEQFGIELGESWKLERRLSRSAGYKRRNDTAPIQRWPISSEPPCAVRRRGPCFRRNESFKPPGITDSPVPNALAFLE